MTEEYINITNIKNDIENDIELNNEIYQIQIINKNTGKIVHIGDCISNMDVIINEFKLDEIYNCIIISKLYTENELKEDNKIGIFKLIKIIINKKNNPIIEFSYCFYFKKNNIMDYISKKNEIKEIDGKYIIIKNDWKKIEIIEEIEEKNNEIEILEKLIYYVIEYKNQEKKLIKKSRSSAETI